MLSQEQGRMYAKNLAPLLASEDAECVYHVNLRTNEVTLEIVIES